MLGAPGMFSLLAEYAKLKGLKSLKFPALRIISSSGAPLQPTVKSQVESLFGMVLHNGYGVTECSPNIAQAVVGEHRTDTSVGQSSPGSGSPVSRIRSEAGCRGRGRRIVGARSQRDERLLSRA